MFKVAIQAEVKEVKQQITLLEVQFTGSEPKVVTRPHPPGTDLSSDQVVCQEQSVVSIPQLIDDGLTRNQDNLEERPPHVLSQSEMILEARTHCDHPLQESIWEAAILMKLLAVGIVGSTFLVVGLLCNIFLQCSFLYVVYHSFLVSPLPDVDGVWEWRELEGHHESNMIQATHSSLVRAICDSQPLLISAANQQSLHDEIVEYQTTENLGIPLGAVLCTMVVCSWVMYIGGELREISSFSNAMLHLPHAKDTQLVVSGEDIVLASCSIGRVVFAMFLVAVRLGIAGTLLTFGSIWLARTISLPSLLLNACALAMVLDVDELIFASVVSRTVKVLVREIKPLKRSMGMPCGEFCSREGILLMNQCLVSLWAFIFIAFIILAYTIPSIQKMEQIYSAFCDGFKDFVFETSTLGVIAVTRSDSLSSPTREETFVQHSVAEVIAVSGADEVYAVGNILYLASLNNFHTMQTSDTGFMVDLMTAQLFGTRCEDYDFAGPDAIPSVGATLKSFFGETVHSCEDLVAHCTGDENLLRAVCPETCGCNQPFSGLYKSGRDLGCPAQCAASATYTSQLASVPCMDYSLSNLTHMPGWTAFLNQWLETWLTNQPRSAESLQQAAAAMLNYGCSGIGFLPARVQLMFCQGSSQYGSLNAYCPMSCNCMNSALGDCPAQCSSMST